MRASHVGNGARPVTAELALLFDQSLSCRLADADTVTATTTRPFVLSQAASAAESPLRCIPFCQRYRALLFRFCRPVALLPRTVFCIGQHLVQFRSPVLQVAVVTDLGQIDLVD